MWIHFDVQSKQHKGERAEGDDPEFTEQRLLAGLERSAHEIARWQSSRDCPCDCRLTTRDHVLLCVYTNSHSACLTTNTPKSCWMTSNGMTFHLTL